MDCNMCSRAVCFKCIRALETLSQSDLDKVTLVCTKCHLLQADTREEPYQVRNISPLYGSAELTRRLGHICS